jgi:hypothetical protein
MSVVVRSQAARLNLDKFVKLKSQVSLTFSNIKFDGFLSLTLQMHYHHESTSLNGAKVLLIMLFVYATSVSSSLTPEEIAEAMNDAPSRYCGKQLTSAMRVLCTPFMKNLISRQAPVKKSCKKQNDF